VKPVHLLVAALFAAAAFAGCADSPSQATTHGDTACRLDGSACPGSLVAPKVDARKTLDDLKSFSQAYPYRQSGSPTHLQARDDLAARFKADGLAVVRQSFSSSVIGGQGPYMGENVLGFKWGSDRTHWVVVGAHYDVTEGAVYGTYDDGSGTALTFELAQAFANLNTTRTLVFAEFDQEERGLIGSSAFVETVLDGTFAKVSPEMPANVTLDGMIDLDMIGITWPHPAHMVVWENSPGLTAKVQELANATGMPADHLEFRKPKGGSSDGASFIKAGIATAYFWSDWDEYTMPGGAQVPVASGYVGTYPWWHKLDTYDTMVASAGNEATLTAGFQTTLDIVSPLLAHMAGPAFVPDPEESK
jgi:hypothetical protein